MMAGSFALLPPIEDSSDDDAAPPVPATSAPRPTREPKKIVSKSTIEQCLLKVVPTSCDCQKQRSRSRRGRCCFEPFRQSSPAFHELVTLRFSWSNLHKLDADNKARLGSPATFLPPFLFLAVIFSEIL